jgi:hypothetical protein
VPATAWLRTGTEPELVDSGGMAEDLDYYPRAGSSWRGLDMVLRRLTQAPSVDCIASSDVRSANRDMRHLGCRTRYRPDGTPFMLAPGDQDPALHS